MSEKKLNSDFPRDSVFIRGSALLTVFAAAVLLLIVTSCVEDETDDSTMTSSLLNSYMDSLCSFDISAMNENNLCKLDDYSDSEEVKSSCKLIADSITWSADNVNINGSTAVAQVKITLPSDIEKICSAALNEAMVQTEYNTDKNFDELMRSEIKKSVGDCETREISAEISMSKVGNKWYISQSPDTASIISEIRTPVAAVYSVAGGQ